MVFKLKNEVKFIAISAENEGNSRILESFKIIWLSGLIYLVQYLKACFELSLNFIWNMFGVVFFSRILSGSCGMGAPSLGECVGVKTVFFPCQLFINDEQKKMAERPEYFG